MARRAHAAIIALVVALGAGLVTAPASVAAQATQAFESDDFSTGTLGARWSVVDPAGDGQVALLGAGTPEARLGLSVPAGTSHDAWGANRSLRVMQPAADVDFAAEARWTTVPTQKYQSQGLLVQQDEQNWLRFDVHSTGSALRVFASETVAGKSTSLLSRTVVSGAEVGLRIQRSGGAWTVAYSDGVSWTQVATVQHALAVSSVGPFAGNSGPSPAYSSEVDYVMDLAAPITHEDGTPAETVALTTDVVGSGAVTRSPDAASYLVGSEVELTAVPAAGWEFVGWSGDVSGAGPVVSVTMSRPLSVTASFVQSTEQPVKYFALDVVVSGQGVVGRSPSGSEYAAGTTVQLTAAPAEGWEFVGWSGDASGTDPVTSVTMTASRSVSATFTESVGAPPPTGSSSVTSDDFSTGLLDTDLWTVVDPVGDGQVSVVGGGTGDVRLAMSVPAGVAHDAFNSNRSLRVLQAVTDEDLDVSARFTSAPVLGYQIQGLLLQQDSANWIRVDVHSTGSGTRLYAGKTVAGKTTKVVQRSVPAAAEYTLRVQRTGDVWVVEYSTDGGLTWTAGGQFTHALATTAVGPFVGNSGTKPAFTAEVDWFFDTGAPVEPEDGTVVESFALDVQTVGEGTVTLSPSASSYPVGTEVAMEAVPAVGWTFTGWSGSVSGTGAAAVLVTDGPEQVTATFEQLPPPPPSPPVIDVWYGDDQTFGGNGTPQRWVNVLGNVSDETGVVSLTYSLNASAPTTLQLGPNLRRLYAPGDFNVQIPTGGLPAGESTVVLRAVDTDGEVTEKSVVLRRSAGTAPLPLVVDWSLAGQPNDLAQVVDGKWQTGADGLTVLEMGYDRTVAVGDHGWTDYEVTVPVTVRGLGPGQGTPQSGASLVGMGLHWDGHTPREAEEPAVNWFPTGAFAWYEWYGSGRHTLQGNEGWPLVRKSMAWDFGTTYLMKARVETVEGGVRYSYKYWPQGTVEPAAWILSVVEDAGPGEGAVLLIAHHVDATFGTVRVDPL